jgi:S-adenosylmethionine hydrolase
VKGVILNINPRARLVDLSHTIPPQDVQHTAWFLVGAIPPFPKTAMHLVVVDPGVGTDRPLLYVEVDGRRLVVPDNGCWTLLAQELGTPPHVTRLEESRYWCKPVSNTFHGRDILAPVMAHLSLGVSPELLGPATAKWKKLTVPSPTVDDGRVTGSILFVDHFGNLITNIRESDYETLGGELLFRIGATEVRRFVRAYAQACPGELVVLISSSGRLEIAIAQGNAASALHAEVGTKVELIRAAPS